MKNLTFSAIFLTFFFSLTSGSVFATETTTPPASPSSATTMQDKIRLLVEENLSTTEAKLKEKIDLQSLVGFAGSVKSVGSNNLTLDSHNNLIQVTISASTTIQKDGKAIKLSSIALGDKIIVIGTLVKDDIIQAKKVSFNKQEPSLVTTTTVITDIVSLNTTKKTITLSLGNSEQTLTLSKKSTVKLSDLQPGQKIFAIIKEYDGKLFLSAAKSL